MQKKRVIVTGSTYGIGASITKSLVNDGWSVASMARSSDKGKKQEEDLSDLGRGSIKYYQCDVSDREQVKSAFAAAATNMQGVDALVHVAAVETGHVPEDETDADWDLLFGVNAYGTFVTNQEVFPYLKENGGRILNFGAGAALIGLPEAAIYSASKAAAMGYSRALANAWGKYNIAVNTILPGMWTPMYDEYRARLSPAELATHDAEMARRVKIGGKLGDPDRDLAPVILFLLSDGARFLTGHGFSIDGGVVPLR